ncbi:hypothetical protein ETD86_23000 [Nonomuraea turkmeniaca]|uniref:Uncharacterized protein n=1 Tax=Nonomuraea turkmeniaca TaxID=103838 RepID=A0A5S4FGI3_9ACTN|nr:hypothetical protein [Nonomuraea turkmeniaca]TMR17662.1 hypothetical protein ETD86_23000 [Nonomuraea turkmeniaca]
MGRIDGRAYVYLGTYGRSMWVRAPDEALTAVRSAQLGAETAQGLAGVTDYASLAGVPVYEHSDRLAAALATLAHTYWNDDKPKGAAP